MNPWIVETFYIWDYSDEKVTTYLNAELVNTFGNLLNRCTSATVNPAQVIPQKPLDSDLNRTLGGEGNNVLEIRLFLFLNPFVIAALLLEWFDFIVEIFHFLIQPMLFLTEFSILFMFIFLYDHFSWFLYCIPINSFHHSMFQLIDWFLGYLFGPFTVIIVGFQVAPYCPRLLPFPGRWMNITNPSTSTRASTPSWPFSATPTPSSRTPPLGHWSRAAMRVIKKGSSIFSFWPWKRYGYVGFSLHRSRRVWAVFSWKNWDTSHRRSC